MAEKGFGVKEINLIGASGTPTIESPNNLNLNAVNVAISTNVSIGGTLSVTGNVSVGGTLTYEDVTNIDSVGVITARSGVDVDDFISVGSNIHLGNAGVVTATTFSGSAASLTSVPAANITGTLPAISGANLTGITITPTNSDIQVVYTVTANGSSAYRFAGNGVVSTADDPDLYLIRGQKYRFINNSGGSHPFQIREASGGTAYSTGVTNNGASSGNIDFAPTYDSPAQLVYQCTSHSGMVGNIYLKDGNGNETNVGVTTFSGLVHLNQLKKTSGTLDYLAATHNFANAAGSTEYLRITSDGDVKIKSYGNASNASADALQIGKTDNNYGITILSATNAQGRIDFTDTEDTNNPQGKIAYYHDSNTLQFFVNGGAATDEKLRITSTGVNIPSSTNTSYNKGFTPSILTINNNSADNTVDFSQGIVFTDNANNQGDGGWVHAAICTVGTTGYNGNICFGVDNNGGANNNLSGITEKVRIPADSWGLLVTNLASTGSTGGYQTEGVSLRYSGDSTFVKANGAAVTMTRQSNAGKVLDFYNGTTYAGGIYVNGNNQTALQQGSDYRLKDDITSMTDGINKVKQLNPIYYKSKMGFDTTATQTGFLAHEVQSVIPTLVDGEKDADIDERGKGYQTLNYAGFAPTAIAAIKELIAKVETLESEVAALKSN